MSMKMPAGITAFVARWISVDNVALLSGIALVTAGASQWSARAGLLTCGGLILGFTLLKMFLSGPR